MDTVSSIFAPVSTPAHTERTLAVLVLLMSAGVFLLVAALLTYSIVRFRARRGDQGGEPPQVYGSGPVEAAWTVVPFIIVVVLSLATARTIYNVQAAPRPPSAFDVTVVGRQWWWEVRYPKLGIVTANEIHLPVSDSARRRPTFLRLESADVAHSFWVPRLAGKTDLIPNHVNEMWVEPFTPGVYLGQCAEYCGTQHANMLLRVVVERPEEFARWVEAQRRPAVEDSAGAVGRQVFMATACVSCHTVRGTMANGLYGPDLTHLMSRATLGAGVVPNTRERLRAWIRKPGELKPGVLMPAMQLDERELDLLVDYMMTLR
jgi:cytochrome c oxidase subunit II